MKKNGKDNDGAEGVKREEEKEGGGRCRGDTLESRAKTENDAKGKLKATILGEDWVKNGPLTSPPRLSRWPGLPLASL